MRKYSRQGKILELIKNRDVETQEDLTEELRKISIEVTQATVSRDIKELGLVKVLTKDGKYKYASISHNQDSNKDRLINIFKSSIVSINNAGQLIVIKTLPGAAQISGSAIDALGIEDVIGTIAGDDTIFVAIGDKNRIDEVSKIFHLLLE